MVAPAEAQSDREAEIADAAAWLELAGRTVNLSVARLVRRLHDGDDDLVDAVLALTALGGGPSARLAAIRDFLVTQELCEPVYPERGSAAPSPFDVPEWVLAAWFPKTDRRLLRPQQFYDCLPLGNGTCPPGRDVNASFSWRMFGNMNVGDSALTNLMVAGQFGADSDFLATAWWLAAPGGDVVETVLTHSYVAFVIGGRHEAVSSAITLRQRQTLLTWIPRQEWVTVNFEHRLHDERHCVPSAAEIPIYIFVEGWTVRRVR